jgi:hypothetical protein
VPTAAPSPGTVGDPVPGAHTIELRLREISQLFNSLDPSPFNEQDLDRDAEEFIVGWARELPRRRPLRLVLHLEKPLPEGRDSATVVDAVHHYFKYRAAITGLELRQLFKQGRMSLLIGTVFLAGCLLLSRLISPSDTNAAESITREGLTIGGWVAMWRPMEIYLYDWWPLWRRGALQRRLSGMKIDLRLPR